MATTQEEAISVLGFKGWGLEAFLLSRVFLLCLVKPEMLARHCCWMSFSTALVGLLLQFVR